MASAVSYRQSFLHLCDLPCDEGDSTSRFCEQICRPLSTPLFFSECFKKTEKSVVMGKRRFTVQELLNLNNGDFFFITKDIRSSLALGGWRMLMAEESSVDSKGCRECCYNGDVYEGGRERKRRKTSQPRNSLSDKCLKRSKNLSGVDEMGRERKRKKTSEPINSLPDKCLVQSKNPSRVDEAGNESKRKKISEPTNAMSRKCLVPSKNLSRINEVGCESQRKSTSERRNPLADKCLAPSNSLSKGSMPQPSLVSSPEDSNLRAAMIGSQFADNMLRVQEKMIFKKAEEDRFETTKTNFKAELRVAETKLKNQRQREQQTARIGVVCETKKTSEPTNSLPDERLVPSDRLSRISEPKASAVSSPVDLNLRAAMIKIRFADTILRSQEKMILNQADKSEKEKLKRRKANVEAELKFAETKLKEQRQKEREAARIELEKMERSVEWNHALEMVQEFQRLIGVDFHGDVKPFDRGAFRW